MAAKRFISHLGKAKALSRQLKAAAGSYADPVRTAAFFVAVSCLIMVVLINAAAIVTRFHAPPP